MGSIQDLFELFTNTIWAVLQSGSAAADAGSTAAEGVFGTVTGSIGNVING